MIVVEIAGGWFNRKVIMLPKEPRFPEDQSLYRIPGINENLFNRANRSFGPPRASRGHRFPDPILHGSMRRLSSRNGLATRRPTTYRS